MRMLDNAHRVDPIGVFVVGQLPPQQSWVILASARGDLGALVYDVCDLYVPLPWPCRASLPLPPSTFGHCHLQEDIVCLCIVGEKWSAEGALGI
jgi:hypothetical protein